MKKYSVQQAIPDLEDEKTASEKDPYRCPGCGAHMTKEGQNLWCPECGTKPYEGEADANEEG